MDASCIRFATHRRSKLKPLIDDFQRLGLRRLESTDEGRIARPLLDLMSAHNLDFHGTFRRLSSFRLSMAQSSEELDQFIEKLLILSSEPERLDKQRAQDDLRIWLEQYAERVDAERDLWNERTIDAERREAMNAVNPRFVLRQWLLEEVIKNVEGDVDSGKRLLAKVLQVGVLCDVVELQN